MMAQAAKLVTQMVKLVLLAQWEGLVYYLNEEAITISTVCYYPYITYGYMGDIEDSGI